MGEKRAYRIISIKKCGIGIFMTAVTSLLFPVIPAGEAGAQTTISSCITISSPGTYILRANITNSDKSSCINITSSNVIFEGAGYDINGINKPNSYAVYVYNSKTILKNVTVRSPSVTRWSTGIYLKNSNNGRISGISASNNYYGIYLQSSSNNKLIGNKVSLNTFEGIYILYSGNSTLINNNMTGSRFNFGVDGYQDSDFNNSIDTSNKVDGKPVIYTKNRKDTVYDISSNAGTIYCIWCSNVTIKNLTLTKNNHGIMLWKADKSTVRNTSILNNRYGIYVAYSNNSSISSNQIISNSEYGIYLKNSNSSIISNNLFNNTNNFMIKGTVNRWNITRTTGKNIIGGPYLGGNFWANPISTGSARNAQTATKMAYVTQALYWIPVILTICRL